MTSEELAETIEGLVRMSRERTLGTGNEQYSDGENQRFEQLSLDEIFSWAEEELVDLVNYCTFLWIRLERMRGHLTDAGLLSHESKS